MIKQGLKLSLLCAVLVFSGSVLAQSANSTDYSRSIVSIQNVSKSQIVYMLQVVKPEYPMERLISEFKSKQEIIACEAFGNDLVITTVSDIDRYTIISIAKAAGFRNTYNAYKQEVRIAQIPEKQLEKK